MNSGLAFALLFCCTGGVDDRCGDTTRGVVSMARGAAGGGDTASGTVSLAGSVKDGNLGTCSGSCASTGADCTGNVTGGVFSTMGDAGFVCNGIPVIASIGGTDCEDDLKISSIVEAADGARVGGTA